jgi:membrane protein DedA with SNARE-associated domain
MSYGLPNFLVWNVLGALTWAPTMVIAGYLAETAG